MFLPKSIGDNNSNKEILLSKLQNFWDLYQYLYSIFEWKAVLIKNSKEENWIIHSSAFYLHEEGFEQEQELEYDYSVKNLEDSITKEKITITNIRLVRKYLEFSDVLRILEENNFKPSETDIKEKPTAKITIKDQIIENKIYDSINWDFSSHTYNYDDWSFYRITISHSDRNIELPFPLVSDGSPYFTNFSFYHAFFNIPGSHIEKGRTLIIIPFYHARIKKIQINRNNIELSVENNMKEKLIAKISYRYDNYHGGFNEFKLEGDNISIDIEERDYDHIEVALISDENHLLIQEKSLGYHPFKLQSIKIPSNLKELYEFTSSGEDQIKEFKEFIESKDSFNQILKEMVAFSNTNDGIICVGVSDDGLSVSGIDMEPRKFKDTLTQVVSDNCVPSTMKYFVEDLDYQEKRIYLIIVKEGEDKPYLHRQKKHFYIRANSTSRPIMRNELMDIFSR